ncbi:phage tail tube protein [Streptomyces sp. XD-27]|uniref:phage tail tube protein n=1 Tax=Streptomyces sp. XD-27 TaxID=3062779 RepID=UPI0026F462C2|nr:phage tail tube protein [Streptomyces sp. XD-27]WKX70050.1 phage tail tube protein [Streptomyces sp. XD-27]
MHTPTPPAESVTALARRYRLELDMGTEHAPRWTLVPGITEFTPKIEPTQQDVSTYDTEGWVEQAVTMLAWSIEATIAHRAHPKTGAFNAAQEALRKASMRFGAESYVRVRYYDRNGADDAYEGTALVTWEPEGGGPDEVDTIEVTLTGSGALTPICNPARPVFLRPSDEPTFAGDDEAAA